MRSFEKHIKNKADTFRLDPLPDSFDKVMAALEKKKKRRFLLWLWWIVPGFLLAGGSTLLYHFYPAGSTPVSALLVKSSHTHTIHYHPDHYPQAIFFSDTKGAENMSGHTEKKENVLLVRHTKQAHQTKRIEKQTVQHEENLHQEKTHTEEQVTEAQENNQVEQTNKVVENREANAQVNPSFLASVRVPLSRSALSAQLIPHIDAHLPPMQTERPSRFSVGVYADLGVSKSNYYNNRSATDSAAATYAASRQNTDMFIFTYSAGIQFRYSPVRFLALETGIGFTRVESHQVVAYGGSMYTDLFTLSSYAIGAQEYRNIYDYISIPIKIYYQKKWKWIGTEAGAGISFDLPVHTQSYVVNDSSGLSNYTDQVAGSRLIQLGIGLSVQAHAVFHIKKFSFFVGPIFKYKLNSMFDKSYIIRQHNYFIGAETGVRYNF